MSATRAPLALAVLLLAACCVAAGTAPGRAAGEDPAAGPDTAAGDAEWPISAAAIFPGGEPANDWIAEAAAALGREDGDGAPVSLAEFKAWCDAAGPAAELAALRRYAVPGSVANQHQDHATYGRRLMRDDRLDAGSRFLVEQKEWLRAAQAQYEVSRHDIVSILMWESALGRITGRTRVLNVLLSQLLYLERAHAAAVAELRASGDYDEAAAMPERERARRYERLKRRAVKNLVALLRLAKAKGQDPAAQLGSWAGAIGYPQFMPASLEYAVDGDGDGVIDLNHWPDAIFSVASYLHGHRYTTSYAGRKRGIRAYNPIDSYMHGVIRYADAIARR